MLNRSDQPRILEPEQLVVQRPERIKLPNGVPLSVLNAGDNEVTRIDLLMAGGRWQQKQPLQALFTNRMLREGTRRYDAAQIAEKLDYYGAWLELSSASEYAYVTLYSLNKYLPQTLDILESIVKEPVFPEKELGVIVDNNIQQFLVNSSKVDFLAHRASAAEPAPQRSARRSRLKAYIRTAFPLTVPRGCRPAQFSACERRTDKRTPRPDRRPGS